jgi:hypothetical protein
VQNTRRLIDLFGPGQAEPVLRSTVAALLNSADDGNPATGDYAGTEPQPTSNRRGPGATPGLI